MVKIYQDQISNFQNTVEEIRQPELVNPHDKPPVVMDAERDRLTFNGQPLKFENENDFKSILNKFMGESLRQRLYTNYNQQWLSLLNNIIAPNKKKLPYAGEDARRHPIERILTTNTTGNITIQRNQITINFTSGIDVTEMSSEMNFFSIPGHATYKITIDQNGNVSTPTAIYSSNQLITDLIYGNKITDLHQRIRQAYCEEVKQSISQTQHQIKQNNHNQAPQYISDFINKLQNKLQSVTELTENKKILYDSIVTDLKKDIAPQQAGPMTPWGAKLATQQESIKNNDCHLDDIIDNPPTKDEYKQYQVQYYINQIKLNRQHLESSNVNTKGKKSQTKQITNNLCKQLRKSCKYAKNKNNIISASQQAAQLIEQSAQGNIDNVNNQLSELDRTIQNIKQDPQLSNGGKEKLKSAMCAVAAVAVPVAIGLGVASVFATSGITAAPLAFLIVSSVASGLFTLGTSSLSGYNLGKQAYNYYQQSQNNVYSQLCKFRQEFVDNTNEAKNNPHPSNNQQVSEDKNQQPIPTNQSNRQ